jgi:hypothetical protein
MARFPADEGTHGHGPCKWSTPRLRPEIPYSMQETLALEQYDDNDVRSYQ